MASSMVQDVASLQSIVASMGASILALTTDANDDRIRIGAIERRLGIDVRPPQHSDAEIAMAIMESHRLRISPPHEPFEPAYSFDGRMEWRCSTMRCTGLGNTPLEAIKRLANIARIAWAMP